jgi:cbb3-type cytochrome oxidase cytochrome c subunit
MSQFNQMNTTIVESVAVANVIHLFGRNPIQVTCPACHQQVLTQIREEDGGFVWASVIVLCFM